jgi:putative sigma-54 modulation protein
MNITLTGRSVNVTPRLKKYVESKIGKFDRYLTDITEAAVVLSIQKQVHRAEVIITAGGAKLTAVGTSKDDIFAAIDDVVDKASRQVTKLKGKRETSRKAVPARAKQAARDAQAAAAAPEHEEVGVIVRKRFRTKPMSAEEALLALERSDLSFHVFIDDRSDRVNVIYKMADGNFGLIVPSA